MRIAVLGLGIIGAIWSRHWHADGHAVRAWNRTDKPDHPGWTADPLDAVRGAELVALVVADGPATTTVVERILPVLGPGMTVCQHATIGTDEVATLAARVRATGARFLDMPFTGSKPAAEARQNVFFIGDDDGSFAAVEAPYRRLAKACVAMGPVGGAMAAKLAFNLMIANTYQALAEGLSVARAAGITDGDFFAALDLNVARSGLVDLKRSKLEQGDFSPQFSIKHMGKDLELVRRLAMHHSVAISQTDRLSISYQDRIAAGDGDDDFAAMIRATAAPVVDGDPDQRRIAVALAATQDAVWDWDLRSGQVWYSPRWYTMLGYEANCLPYTYESWVALTDPEDVPRTLAAVQVAVAEKGGYAGEFRMRHRDGSWRWILGRGHVTEIDAQGRPIRFSGTNTDITDLKRAEASLIRQERDAVIGRMAGRVAHEVNNPLEAIRAYIQPLRRRAAHLPDVDHGLTVIDRQVDRIAKLTRSLLGLVRQGAEIRERVVVGDILTIVSDLYRPQFEAAGKTIEVHCRPGLPDAAMDPDQVQQLLLNLVDNALHAVERKGWVGITASDDDGVLVITVEDDGPGLGPDPEHVFQPFFTTKIHGTGLGLPVARRICEAHGGSLQAGNRAPRGAVFTIRLPWRPPDVAAGQQFLSH
jgi:PAS domain S-box-containing protein